MKNLRNSLAYGSGLQHNLKNKLTSLSFQVDEMEKKLIKLRGGVTLVSPEERKAIEGLYSEALNQWRIRKRMFRDVWDAITENSPKNPKEFKVLISLSLYWCLFIVKYTPNFHVHFRRNLELRMMMMLVWIFSLLLT